MFFLFVFNSFIFLVISRGKHYAKKVVKKMVNFVR